MFTKDQIAALHRELDAVLKKFAVEHNLIAGNSRIRYSAADFKVEVSFGDTAENPNAVDPRFLNDLARNGWKVGLKESMVGKTITTGRGPMTFQGMRASKAVAKDSDGKIWLYPAEAMSKLLNA